MIFRAASSGLQPRRRCFINTIMKTIPFRFSILAAFALLCAFQAPAFSQEAKWYTDFAKAAAEAKAGNKSILLDFTGSDWCPWCIRMKKETLDQAAFKDYAAKNLVLMEVDFPDSKPQTEAVKKQNKELQAKYKADGFPTFVLVDADGNIQGKQVGYMEGGPSPFIELLNKWHTPNPSAATAATTISSSPGTSGTGSDFDNFFKKSGQ